MSATPVQADAHCLPLPDNSVDLIITSPPYFALRSYRDGGEHYDGQVGSEPTPQAFLEALWEVSKEAWRVLKPTGSYFVNLGDKRSGSGGHNNSSISHPNSFHIGTGRKSVTSSEALRIQAEARAVKATRRNAPDRYNQAAFGRPKSKMLLPHRFAIGCEDGMADPEGIGWIVRSDMVWSKPNGLPESVTDRVRDSHEYWFHFVKQGRYFSAVDEIREPHEGTTKPQAPRAMLSGNGVTHRVGGTDGASLNPLGKLPGSVWTIASEPLTIPEAVKAHYDLPDHFAAFPQEWPRRLILGWSPSGVCVACGEGRRPVTLVTPMVVTPSARRLAAQTNGEASRTALGGTMTEPASRTITGYACACPDDSAPTKPAVVVDIFGGTGTVAGVARALGRTGISFDLSHDYSRLAHWFLNNGRRFSKTTDRTNKERQGVML